MAVFLKRFLAPECDFIFGMATAQYRWPSRRPIRTRGRPLLGCPNLGPPNAGAFALAPRPAVAHLRRFRRRRLRWGRRQQLVVEKTSAATQQAGTDLGAIKDYLLEHTERLTGDVATLKENAQQYHDLAEQSDFDTKKMLADNREQVAQLLGDAKKTFVDANPAYEEMEGVVAGVPRSPTST